MSQILAQIDEMKTNCISSTEVLTFFHSAPVTSLLYSSLYINKIKMKLAVIATLAAGAAAFAPSAQQSVSVFPNFMLHILCSAIISNANVVSTITFVNSIHSAPPPFLLRRLDPSLHTCLPWLILTFVEESLGSEQQRIVSSPPIGCVAYDHHTAAEFRHVRHWSK